MNNNHPLRAVIFDYGRVLSFPPSDADWAALAAATALPLETLHRRYWESRESYDLKELSAADYWSRVIGHKISRVKIADLVALDGEQWSHLNADMLSRARNLKASGVKIAILSNMPFELLRAMHAKFDWLDEFDVQMYSWEVAMVKPTPAFYLECLRRLETEPAETLFLDDKEKNIAGAERVGIHTLLFDGDIGEFDRKLAQLRRTDSQEVV